MYACVCVTPPVPWTGRYRSMTPPVPWTCRDRSMTPPVPRTCRDQSMTPPVPRTCRDRSMTCTACHTPVLLTGDLPHGTVHQRVLLTSACWEERERKWLFLYKSMMGNAAFLPLPESYTAGGLYPSVTLPVASTRASRYRCRRHSEGRSKCGLLLPALLVC